MSQEAAEAACGSSRWRRRPKPVLADGGKRWVLRAHLIAWLRRTLRLRDRIGTCLV